MSALAIPTRPSATAPTVAITRIRRRTMVPPSRAGRSRTVPKDYPAGMSTARPREDHPLKTRHREEERKVKGTGEALRRNGRFLRNGSDQSL
jgi:hypothetical protein